MFREKIAGYRFFYVMAILSLIGFIVRTGADWYQYNRVLNSAPFYVFVLSNAIVYLGAGVICAVVGRILQKKAK